MTSVNSKKIKVFTLISLVVAVVAAVVRTLVLTKIVETDTGLYTVGSSWGYVCDICIIAAVVAVILIGRLLLRNVRGTSELDSGSTVTVFGSALCAFMFFSVFIYGIYLMLFTENTVGLLFKIEMVLCIPCGFNQLVICAKEHRKKGTGDALLAMSAPILFALRIVDIFMNTTTQMNTSQRSFELVMLCATMLFFLYESAFLVEKDTSQKERSRIFGNYYVSAVCVVVLTFLTTIPGLLVSVFWVFENNFLIMDVLQCCVMLYAAARLITAKD